MIWNKSTEKPSEHVISGTQVTLQELIDLRYQVTPQLMDNINKWLKLSGPRLARMRGRGLEFDTTREYQAGDDIRNMAWRVTARSLKPYIKVYQQEKERPIWLAIDLSPSLYFGTRRMFKSVSLIKQAALLGWTFLHEHERIGAMIATEEKISTYKPQANERHFLTVLHALSQYSNLQPSFNNKNVLHQLLTNLQHHVRSDNLVFIFSDFLHFDQDMQKIIAHIAQRAQVALVFTYDPFEAEPPPPHQYMLTNDQQKILFDMSNAQNRLHYQQQFQRKQNELIHFSHQHNIALKILRTDQD